ncbi:MAG: carboxypeptidase-like regulatory domain-containing protein, partial [Gemmatimonadaceae bacterium]
MRAELSFWKETRMGSSLRPLVAALAGLLFASGTSAAQQPTGRIAGTVTQAGTGMPVGNATVLVVGTRLGTQTADSGTYVLARVPAGSVRLRFQRIGFTPVEHDVVVTVGATARVDAILTPSAVALSEVVTTATGATQVRELGNSVAVIDTAQIRRQAATDPQQILA